MLTSADHVAFQQAADLLRKEVTLVYTTHPGARQPYNGAKIALHRILMAIVPARTIVLLQPPRFQSALDLPRKTLALTDTTSAQEIVAFVKVEPL